MCVARKAKLGDACPPFCKPSTVPVAEFYVPDGGGGGGGPSRGIWDPFYKAGLAKLRRG